ncbi:MAG: hypothetical protein ACR2KT_06910 [Methylocella sp.]
MFDVVIFRARHVILTIGLMGIFLTNASGAPNTLTVQDARPVAKAIEELDKRYGWQITYEDLPYSDMCEMVDVVTAPGAKPRLVPKWSLSFALPSTGQDQASAVEVLVNTYKANGHGNVFAVMHGVRLLHVVPRKVRGLSGIVKPVLDTVITVEPKERTAEELLDEICKKISIGANTTVEVGMIQVNMFASTKTSIGSSGKTARSILEQLILELGAPLSWQLFYDPEYKMYALNIHSVASSSKTIVRRGSGGSTPKGII